MVRNGPSAYGLSLLYVGLSFSSYRSYSQPVVACQETQLVRIEERVFAYASEVVLLTFLLCGSQSRVTVFLHGGKYR